MQLHDHHDNNPADNARPLVDTVEDACRWWCPLPRLLLKQKAHLNDLENENFDSLKLSSII